MKKLLLITIALFSLMLNIQCLKAQWEKTIFPDSIVVTAFAISGENIFAGTDSSGIFLSTNNGNSWTQVNNGLTNTNVMALAINGGNIFAGTWGGGVFLSTNNGNTWTAVNNGLNYFRHIWALAISGGNIFASGAFALGGNGVFLSTNNGNDWMLVNNGLTGNEIWELAISGDNIFAGTIDGVYLSTNNGNTWTQVNNGLTSIHVIALAINGENIFAGTDISGIFLSTNNGNNWTQVKDHGYSSINTIAISGDYIFAATHSMFGCGIYLSNNNGGSWTQVNNGLIDGGDAGALAISGENIFAGTSHYYHYGDKLGSIGVYRAKLSDFITSVEEEKQSEYALNISPNPFSESTSINYELQTAERVKIDIFNSIGEKITTLVDEYQEAGSHNCELRITNYELAVGMYYYTIRIGDRIESGKIMLIR